MFQSNQTGLRIAEEQTPKVLPGSPVWVPAEPNGYDDFGGEVKTVARAPIAPDRQMRKGTVVDIDATGGFTTDFTTDALTSTIQGFMFASWRRKTTQAAQSPSAVAAGAYTVPSGGAGYLVNSLVFGAGYTNAINNGMKVVTASTGTSVTAAGLVVEATATGTIARVGHRGAAADLTMTLVSTKLQLNATALNLTTLGLIPGEWVWIGGDALANRFATAANTGFYRVFSIAAGVIVFDRWPDGAAADAGTGKQIDLYFGQVLKNEADPTLQVKRTYALERSLNAAGTMVEYVNGSCPNTLKLDTKTADKLTAQMGFIGLAVEQLQALKGGARPSVQPNSPYSASADYQRLRLTDDATGAALAVYMTDLSLQIDNGVEADKAIGYVGGVDHSIGSFNVTGDVEAFFSSQAAISAAQVDANVSIDLGLVTNVFTPNVGNQAVGWLFDLPSIDLGDARLKIEKDKKIKLPLKMQANAHASLNHTLLLVNFQYLPQLAL